MRSASSGTAVQPSTLVREPSLLAAPDDEAIAAPTAEQVRDDPFDATGFRGGLRSCGEVVLESGLVVGDRRIGVAG
jgi:hypothetical protein